MPSTLVDEVAALGELIEREAAGIEVERRISDPVLAAIRSTGLNRSVVPASLGGSGVPLLEVVEAVERIATFDGSTGWCAAIGAGSNLFAGYVPERASADVFRDPDQPSAGMFGPFGQVREQDGELRLTGRWPFCSNCLHSEWIGLGAFWFGSSDQPEPAPRLVFVPMTEVTVEPTWDTRGLCGTGSHHTTVADVAVTRERSMSLAEASWDDSTLGRLPAFCVLVPMLGVTPLGMARGAVDELLRSVEAGGGGATRGALVEDPVGLADLARADALLRGARANLFEACALAWETAERGDPIDRALQARIMLAVSVGAEVAVDVTATAHRLAGGAAAYAGHPVLRRLRDVETARQHIIFSHQVRPALVKVLAGHDLPVPPFIV